MVGRDLISLEELKLNLLFKLTPSSDYRPVIDVKFGKDVLKCLVDTGSNIPAFTLGLDYFLKLFPSAKFYKTDVIRGYGGSREYDIYVIPSMRLSDGKSTLVINNYYTIVCDKMSNHYDVLLSVSIFSRASLLFNFESKICKMKFSSDSFYGALRQDSVFYIFSKEEEEECKITAAAMRVSLGDRRKE